MNKKLICIIAFVFAFSFAFIACSDNDDTSDYTKGIVGTYDGTIKIEEFNNIELPNSIILTRVANNKVKVALAEIEIPNGDLPSVKIKNIEVNNVPVVEVMSVESQSNKSKNYVLNKTTEKIKIDFGLEFDVEVTVSGTIVSGELNLKIATGEVVGYPDGLDIFFTGDKK